MSIVTLLFFLAIADEIFWFDPVLDFKVHADKCVWAEFYKIISNFSRSNPQTAYRYLCVLVSAQIKLIFFANAPG